MRKILVIIVIILICMELDGCMLLLLSSNEREIVTYNENVTDTSDIYVSEAETKKESQNNVEVDEKEYKNNCIEIITHKMKYLSFC